MELTLKNIINTFVLVSLLSFSFNALADDEDDDDGFMFKHGIVLKLDGKKYYLHGPSDGPNGEQDVPGHYWAKVGKKKLIGKHYNTGSPLAFPKWSSDAEEGELLYIVEGKLDKWTEKKSYEYFIKGFTHYHHLVSVDDGSMHPSKVLWLKHVAKTSFELDMGPHPEAYHSVKPGLDYEFVPNWDTPYMPGHSHVMN